MSYEARRSPIGRLALLLPALWLLVPASAEAQEHRELFVVGRSTNRNVLKYSIKLAQPGQPDAERPVSAYWVMHEAGGRRESLTWFEQRFAYGWEIVGGRRHSQGPLRGASRPRCGNRESGVRADRQPMSGAKRALR
jgi:hypothetical protein